MNAAEALKAAGAAGVGIAIDGGKVVLRPPPPAVLDLLSRHKAEIVALLCPAEDGCLAEDWQVFFDERAGIAEFDGGLPRPQAETQAFACCVADWLRRNPECTDAVQALTRETLMNPPRGFIQSRYPA